MNRHCREAAFATGIEILRDRVAKVGVQQDDERRLEPPNVPPVGARVGVDKQAVDVPFVAGEEEGQSAALVSVSHFGPQTRP
jgi:hypothetical protein